jgi:hypothetical protein
MRCCSEFSRCCSHLRGDVGLFRFKLGLQLLHLRVGLSSLLRQNRHLLAIRLLCGLLRL